MPAAVAQHHVALRKAAQGCPVVAQNEAANLFWALNPNIIRAPRRARTSGCRPAAAPQPPYCPAQGRACLFCTGTQKRSMSGKVLFSYHAALFLMAVAQPQQHTPRAIAGAAQALACI